MRHPWALVLGAACSGEAPGAVDGAVDARVIDGVTSDPPVDAPLPRPDCSPGATRMPLPPQRAPVPGVHCARWTRVSGAADAFPRYFDRVEVAIGPEPSVRWWTSGGGGAKEYVSLAALEDGCLVAEPFVGGGGAVGSGRVPLCWQSDVLAFGTMAWCTIGISGASWDVRLDACPP